MQQNAMWNSQTASPGESTPPRLLSGSPSKSLLQISLCFLLAVASGGVAKAGSKVVSFSGATAPIGKTDATQSAANHAWRMLKHDYETPPPPLKQLPNRMYTDKELRDYYADRANRAGSVADEAKQFYMRYPAYPQAAKARDMYFDML